MSIVSVDFDGKPVKLDPGSLMDLQQASSDLKFIFGGGLEKYLDQPLSGVPARTSADLTLNAGNPSWLLPGSPAKFSLGASAKFAVTIQQPNQTLFSYNPDLENSQAQKVNITGKAGSCYVITEALFNISGKLSGSASVGAIGVTTDDSASAAYTIRNYKAFSPAAALKDAVLQALTGFTLPLHLKSAANLGDGDGIYYEFDGSLNVGFGATWGVSAQVGGTTISEIGQSLQRAGNIASVSGLTPVTVSAGANLSMLFNWTRSFQCFLERQQPSGPSSGLTGGALLHISAGKTSRRVIQLGVEVEVKGIGMPKASVDTTGVTKAVLSKLTGQQDPPAGQAIGQKVQQAADSYVKDVNDWLAGLTQTVSTAAGKGVALSIYYQNQSQFTSAFTWHFDFTNTQSAPAWGFAMQGDFLKALATGGVTLDAGGGYEQTHLRATGISLALFGMWQFGSAQQYFDSASVIYAGNGRFQLQATAGQTATSTNNGKISSSSVYLAASATGAVNFTGTSLDLSKVNLQLHGVLTGKGDAGQRALLAALLQDLGLALQSGHGAGGADVSQLGGTWKGLAQAGQISLHLIYEMTALQRLLADGHDAGQHPPFAHDESNWRAYAAASDKLNSEPVSYFRGQIHARGYDSYDAWSRFNCAVNGYYTDATAQQPLLNKASRTHPKASSPLSNAVRALMRQAGYFEGTSDDDDVQLGIYFSSGQEYMNLCGDVQDLLRQIANASVDWTGLTKRMQGIAGSDIDPWFGPVVLLALAASCNCASASIGGNTLVPSGNAGATVSLP